MDCGLWGVKCGEASVGCKVWQNGDGSLQSVACATKTANHVLEAVQKYIAPAHQNDFSTRLLTRENVRKCHASHTERHDNLP